MELLPEDNENHPPRWTLIRDIAVLQVKLVVDGLRDLILVPASLVAGIISLSKTKDGVPGTEFYTLVGVGKQSERWINLFGAYKNAPPEVTEQNHFGDADIDDIVSRVESFVVDEYKRGGVTAQARDRMNKAMDAMRRRRKDDEQT
jgi:hypothetical protein